VNLITAKVISEVIVICSTIFTVFGIHHADVKSATEWPCPWYYYLWTISPFIFAAIIIFFKKEINSESVSFFLLAAFFSILFPYFYYTIHFSNPHFRSGLIILVYPAFHWARNILAYIFSIILRKYLFRN